LPIVAGPLRGSLWLAGSAPGAGKGLSTLINRCEPGQLREALRLVRSDTVVFDVGANVGLYSLLFARACRKVYAFEPVPGNLAWLARNLAWNRVSNVTVLPWAAGAESGLTAFAEGEHHSEGRVDASGAMPAFAVSLDAFAARYGAEPSLIKIDVEGGELDVLRGAIGILRARQPAILLSTHGDGPKADCLGFLKELGYAGAKPLDDPDPARAREFAVTANPAA
jgi:FkbM family methyltransferase